MTTRPTSDRATDDVHLTTYAELLARFAHRFADRGGVLEARGLQETDFRHIEAMALDRLQEAAQSGDVVTLSRFAWAVVAGRAALQEGGPLSEPTTRASSTRRTAGEAQRDPETPPSTVATPDEQPPVDLADLMATLSSEVSRSR